MDFFKAELEIKTGSREELALERIKEFKPDAAGFSGGKDSVVVDHLMQRSGLPYQAFMNLTTVDPKIHLDFIREYFPHVERVHPEKSMYQLIIENGLPSRRNRYCCKHLKERVQRGTFVAFGVRRAESGKRTTRPFVHYHRIVTGMKVINPIVDWTDNEVWLYIEKYSLPVSPLYGQPYNFKRVGCIGCPQANKAVTRQFRLFPEYRKYYINAIKKRMERKPKYKKERFYANFESPEQVFDWWISQTNSNQFLAQQTFCMD